MSATSFVSMALGNAMPYASISLGIPGSTGPGLETLQLKIQGDALIQGGGQYTYVGEATFNLGWNPVYTIDFEGSWVITYDKANRFIPLSVPYIGLPISVGGTITISRP
ncbi:MAG: hypothetical protein ACK5RG_20870 [Cyclobacteriaceae bacterium]